MVGSIQIRNRATLVGNVCNASPAADTFPSSRFTGPYVKMLGRGGEQLVAALSTLFRGNRRTALAAGEVATAVSIPFPNQPFGAAFARDNRRDGASIWRP